MNLRSTLILALIFIALGGYLYFVEMERDPDGAPSQRVLDIDTTALTKIELEHPGRKVVLLRQDGVWTMREPVEAPADQRSVENLIEAVSECEISRTLGEVENLATFGLDVPSATVRLFSGDETHATLKVGKSTPVGGSIYVQRDDDNRVFLTAATVQTRIDQKAADLRDKTILFFDERQVRSLTVRGPAGAVVVDKIGDGWAISKPAKYEADNRTVTSVLSALQSMRATDFVAETSDHLERYGLAKPSRSVTIALDEGDPLELNIGSVREGKVRVQTNRRPTVYAVGSWVADSLDKGLNDFRDKTIAYFAAEDAARVELGSAVYPPLVFVRKADEWVAQPTAEAAGNISSSTPSATVDNLVRQLASLSGFEIAAGTANTPATSGLEPAAMTIRAMDTENVELAAVRIGSHMAAGAQIEYAAMRPGGDTIFHIRETEYQLLAAVYQDYLERSATPVPDAETDDDIHKDPLDDAATAGEEG